MYVFRRSKCVYKILTENPNTFFGRHHRNIQGMILNWILLTGCEDVEFIYLGQNREKVRALVHMVIIGRITGVLISP